jgi:hypothetical protein
VLAKINELDDPWVIAMDRAHQAGKLLARVLLAEHRHNMKRRDADMMKQAESGTAAAGTGTGTNKSPVARIMGRPITLVGYGMGARLIFHCLESLAAEGGEEARGIVEAAVLIGR